MKKIAIATLLMIPCALAAEGRLAALWQQMPDGIVPLLSKTNRLDMIDFCENDMESRVTNVLDGYSTMDTLTSDYLHVTLSPQTTLEMKLSGESIIAVHSAASVSSTITIYNKDWEEIGNIPMPAVQDFLPQDADKHLAQTLEAVPLITASLSPDNDSITFTLHTVDLSRDERREAEPLLHKVTIGLQEQEVDCQAP